MDKHALLKQLRIDRVPPDRPPASRSGKRSRIGIAVAIALMAAAAAWFLMRSPKGVIVHTAAAKAIAPAAAGSAAGASVLDASGYVVAMREATVSAKSIYKVNEVLIEEGQAVKEGQVIARLDDTNARAALAQSLAQVNQLQATLEAARVAADDARPSFVRHQKQLAEGLISPETFDTSKAAYDAAVNSAKIAAQNLAVARANVAVNQRFEDDTIIKAPFTGVVTVKNAQPGEIVSPQFSGGGGIGKVVDMDSLEVDVDVNESFINRVHADQAATVTLNAYPDWQIPAQVIAAIPTADRAKATVKVRVGFKVKDPRIVPEMGARVSFLDDASRPVRDSRNPSGSSVLVPVDAVVRDGDSGTVFVVNRDHLERRKVRLGARDAAGQTILSGLVSGEILANGDLSNLADGTLVRVEP